MKEHYNDSKNRRWFLKVALGMITATLLGGSVEQPLSSASQRESELQNLEWYRKWLADGRSVRLVDDQMALGELEKLRLVDVDLTNGLAVIEHPLKYVQQIPNLIQNFQNDSLLQLSWLAPIGEGWTVTVNRYVNLADFDSKIDMLKQKIVNSIDYPNLLEDWSKKSIVTFSKTVGNYKIAWSISNNGGQSNPLLQGGRVERGDYTLRITSNKSGEMIVAVGFAGRLIEPGLDVQHAFKNVGLHSLQSYTDQKTRVRTAEYNFGSLHPPGNFPLENTDKSIVPLNETQINVLIIAISAFVNTAILPQVAVTTV